jgi:hypothetical protein
VAEAEGTTTVVCDNCCALVNLETGLAVFDLPEVQPGHDAEELTDDTDSAAHPVRARSIFFLPKKPSN